MHYGAEIALRWQLRDIRKTTTSGCSAAIAALRFRANRLIRVRRAASRALLHNVKIVREANHRAAVFDGCEMRKYCIENFFVAKFEYRIIFNFENKYASEYCVNSFTKIG